jgi:dTMP kinase
MQKKRIQKKGFLITFEGGEGAGKSTQITHLATWLARYGVKHVLTRQPGGTDLGAKIRNLLLDPDSKGLSFRAEVLLYAADRAQHVDEVVGPALEKGLVVISDRYAESSVVYQGICRKLGVDRIRSLNRFATAGIEPDLIVVLDVPVKVGAQRMKHRRLDRLELEKKTFHENVRKGFLKIARSDPKRFVVINGHQLPEKISNELKDLILSKLKRKGLWKA